MQPPDLTLWLAQPADFAAGVALYAQLGGSSVYQSLFALGETGYSRQVLVRELQALASGPTPMVPATVPAVAPLQPAPTVPVATSKPTQAHTDAPELLQLRAQLKACRDERDLLRAQLTTPGLSRTNRNKMAHRICELTDQVYELQEAEEHVLAHGRHPGPVATADVTDAGELRRRLDNLVSQRARLRKRPERAGELPTLQEQIDLIREKLKLFPRV